MQVHGNVCLASVVVTQTLDWKLHAFDVLSEFDGHNESSVGPMLVNYDSELTHCNIPFTFYAIPNLVFNYESQGGQLKIFIGSLYIALKEKIG